MRNQSANLKQGTVQLARTRDTHRAKQSCTENFRRTPHIAHHPLRRIGRALVTRPTPGNAGPSPAYARGKPLYFRMSFSYAFRPSRVFLPPLPLPFFFAAAAAQFRELHFFWTEGELGIACRPSVPCLELGKYTTAQLRPRHTFPWTATFLVYPNFLRTVLQQITTGSRLRFCNSKTVIRSPAPTVIAQHADP